MSVKTPRFSGPFKWSALRQQLLSLRDDVHTIRKVAGRNVTIDEHRGKGKIINVARDRGAPPPAGCAGCALPTGDCPHAFCLEFTLDSEDTSNRDLIEINGSSGNQIGFYYDQAGNWQLYAAGTVAQLVIPTSDPHGTWHSARIQITRVDNDNVHIVLTVDGNSDNGDFAWTAGDDAANIRVGALQGDSNPVHRTFRCVAALGNPDNSETDFFFPASSFDSLTAGASIDGSGFLRIDHGAVAVDDYGEKAVSYDLPCETPTGACCSPFCSVMTEAECNDAGGTYQGDGTICGDIDPCTECIQDDTLCVTFSGIETCPCYGVNPYYEISDVSMNGSFELTKTSGGGGIVQWEGVGGTVHIKTWSDGLCESAPDSECDASNTYLIIQCIGPPYTEDISYFLGYFVLADDSCAGGTINLFQAGGTGSGNVPLDTPVSNLNNCIDTSHGVPLGQNGTVTISSGPC